LGKRARLGERTGLGKRARLGTMVPLVVVRKERRWSICGGQRRLEELKK
jgi:hypothetical protein